MKDAAGKILYVGKAVKSAPAGFPAIYEHCPPKLQ